MRRPLSLSGPRTRRGFALAEVAVSLAIFALSASILAQTYRAGHDLRAQAHEEGLATTAAQTALELMRGARFDEVVRRFDPDPFNDPRGPGTAHGATFDVPGLEPASDDPDGVVGEVVLPILNVGTEVAPVYQFREDVGPTELGLPRDLNGDATVDDADHTLDAVLIPVVVRVRWQSQRGPRQLEFFTAITEYSKE